MSADLSEHLPQPWDEPRRTEETARTNLLCGIGNAVLILVGFGGALWVVFAIGSPADMTVAVAAVAMLAAAFVLSGISRISKAMLTWW